jgi:hypothetical protein
VVELRGPQPTRWWPRREEWNAHGGRFGYVAGYVPRSDEHWWIRHRTCPVCGCGREGGWGGRYLRGRPTAAGWALPFGWGLLAGPF